MSNPYLDSLQSRALTPGDDAPVNPYLQRLEDEAANRKARLAAQLSQAVKVNPEQYNTQRRVAQYLGYPVAAVETLPELADQAKVQQIQRDTASSPVLQRKYSEADFAKLAHDDSGTLADIWKTLKRGGMVGTWWRFATGTLTPQQPEEIEEPGFRAWNGPKATPLSIVTGLANAIPEAGQAIRQGLRMQMGDALEALGLIKRDPVYLADQQRKLEQSQTSFTRPDIESPTGAAIYSGVESFLRAIPGVAASVATRSPTPMLVSAGGQTQLESYGKYRARGGTPGESFAGATGEAIVEIATEYLPSKYLSESLGKAGAKEFILNFIKKDALGEQAATILQDAIDTAIANPNKTWEEYLAERPMAAYQTLVATLTQAGLMSGVNTAMRRLSQLGDQTGEAEIQADRLQQALQTAGQSLLRERSPEQFRAVMAEMTDGNVYVDGQVLNQLAPEVLNQLPESVREKVATAAAIGDSVEIPVADVLTIAPGTPLEQVIVENARTAPDAPSLAEARAAGEKAQEFLQQEAERVIAQAQDQEALRQSQETVKQNVKQQLAATGRFRDAVNDGYATWAAAFYTAYGSRMGMTPEQFYQRYPLRVLGAPVGQQTGVLNADGGMTLRTVNVGDTVDGRVVRDGVPNLESIGSSLDNYKVLPGVREVPMSAFDPEYVGGISMDRLDERTRRLADEIRASGEITPLIVVQDAQGMYVLEGGHRLDALIASGAQSLPAVVVIDQDNPPGQAYEQSATLRRGTETLKKYGLKPGGKYKTRDVAAALEARQRAKYGTIAADDRSAEALANIAKWMVAEVEFEMSNPEKSGVGWYSEKFQRALDEMGSVFPELKTDKTARNVMTALIAITSDGQKVVPNFAMAMDIYGNYRPGGATAGKFTTTRGHARQASINGNLEVIQRLHDTMGADGMHQYLMQEKTISELKKLAKENGGELKSDYQAHIKMPMAAVEFGPKLGAFYANLMGAHGYLTMDRWWSRTFNRYRGTLLQANTQSALDTFKSLIGKPDISNDEVLAAVVAPREALEARGFKTRLALLVGKSEPSKAKDKVAWMAKARELAGDQFDAMLSEHNIERAANTIYKTAFENLEDAPFNATDRTFMLDAVNKAQQTLKRKGYNLSVADIQAILWYYEKRLYGELGARQTADISYEEAAQRVASSYASGQGIESLLDDAGTAREDGGTDEDGVPVGEDDFAEGTDGVLNQGAVLEQQQAEARDLVLTHNLSGENLLHAQRVGGIPVPSLAVTKSDTPVEGFGEITLIGGPEMADPKGYAGTKVFGADIYSPRYPSIEFKLGNAEMKSLNAALASFRQEGDRELYGSDIRRPDDLTSYKPFKRWAADRYGSDVESLSWSQLTSSVNALMREVGAKERIFQGFTYSGNRRYVDHTLDNVVKILKKALRGGENFNYGVGSIRAKLTPQFKSVAQIRKEKSRLVDKETFDSIKKEIDAEFVGIATTLELSLDQTVEVFEDAPKMGAKRAIERALRDYRQETGDVDVEKVKLVGDFLVKLRNLPTQYFEAKILRAVDVAEFKAAVVPADASPEVLAALADRGVTRVATYDPNNKGDRAAKIQEFSDLFFQGATSPRGTFNPQTLELVLNPNADLSTWFHETGHFFLEVLADVASQPDAPAQIAEDMNRVLAWFGIKGDETVGGADSGMPLEQSRTEESQKAAAEAAGFDTSTVWLHGTTRKFSEFRRGKPGKGVNELGPGIYFTKQELYARAWAGRGADGRIVRAYIKKGDLFDLGVLRRAQTPSQLPAPDEMADIWLPLARRLKTNNAPLTTDDSMAARADALWRTWLGEPDKDLAEHIRTTGRRSEGLNTWLERAGYIGAFNENSQIPDQVVVFDPRNIRAVDAKFDPRKSDSANLLSQSDQPTAPSGVPLEQQAGTVRLYHGSKQPIQGRFRASSKSVNTTTFGDVDTERTGVFFSDNPEFSAEYGEVAAYDVNIESTAVVTRDLVLDFAETIDPFGPDRELYLLAKNTSSWGMFDGEVGRRFVAYLREQGYDSATFQEDLVTEDGRNVESNTTVVFDPERISAATLAQSDQPTAPSAQPLPQRRTPLEVWNAMTLDQKRPYHERWAESIEQYVMEGKAPSVELQGVMRRFSAWLKSVYSSIKQFLALRGVPVAGGSETLGQAPAPEGVLTDGSGKPLVVYHGTQADVEKFDPERIGQNFKESKGGFFFTGSPVLASAYAGRRGGAGGNVIPAYLKLNNPLTLDTYLWATGETRQSALSDRGLKLSDLFDEDPGGVIAYAKDAGHDGVAWINGNDVFAVAFDPKQIISALTGEVLGQGDQPAGPNIQLNDDIRRVMDRMLATDEQIAQANEVAGLVPDEQADGEAAERLQKRSMADLKWAVRARDAAIAKLKREAKAIEKQVREEVIAEVDATPEMRAKKALDALQITPEYEGLVRQHAEERAAVERTERDRLVAELYAANPDVTGLKRGQLLAKNKREIANKVDAYMIVWDKSNPKPSRPMNINDADLATVADSFAFESVPAMLEAISVFGSRQEAIDGMTERRMLEEHGDLIDERTITEAANEAVHNEARARSLATELRTQREMLGARTDTGEVNARGARITVNALVEAAKQFGANVISRTPLKDLRSTAWKHTAAERRAGKRWAEATAAGKTEDAVKAKQDQMLNNAAAKAALDAAAESKKILEFFKRVTKGNDEKTVEKGRDPDIVNAARAVLAAYGIETPTTKGAQDYLDVLQRNDPDTYAAVQPMMAIAMQNAQPIEALTFEELQGLHESIQAMWHLAKRSRQMEVDGDLLDIDEVADELFAKMEEIGIPDTIPGEAGALTKGQLLARQWLQAGPALLRRVEQWAEAKDGKFGGPFLRFIFQPVKDAADRYRKDRLEYRQKFQALVDQVAPAMTQGTIAAPELGYTFGQGHNGIGHAELLHAILHTGNDSNKRKLLLGRGWATENPDGTIDTRRWNAFLQRLHDDGVLTKAHWDFAQGVWDLMEETKPLAQKTHRDVFGRYFEEITANTVQTPFGTYRGGYVPAQADPLLVQEADLRDLLETENAGMSYAFPQTNRGFTKGRVEYNRPLKLDLRTLPQHIDKVLLFSHMEPAVRGVARLIRRPKVNQPLSRIDPAAVSGVLRPWLNRAARQTVETPISADAGMNRMASTIRGRVGMALMFANVSNTLQQITGAFTASIKVPPADMMRAAAQYVANPKKLKESVWALSPYMADRSSNEVAVLSDTLEQILINPSVYQKAEQFTRRHSYFLQTMFDNQMSPIIWTAAYNQALRDGMEERMAIRYADGVIRQTQGSTLPEDVSRIETGPAYARLFTQFVGYFNMMANTNATALQQIAREQGLKKGAGKAFATLMIGLMVPIWVAEAIALAFKGGPEDDEGDGWLDDWIASVLGMGTIKGILSGVPFLGAVAQSAVNRFNDQPADDKFSLSPTVSVLESAVGAPASVYKAIVDDASAQKAVRDSAALITVMTGLPAMTVARPVAYLAGVDQGRIQPTSEVDMARGLITGTASPESKAR